MVALNQKSCQVSLSQPAWQGSLGQECKHDLKVLIEKINPCQVSEYYLASKQRLQTFIIYFPEIPLGQLSIYCQMDIQIYQSIQKSPHVNFCQLASIIREVYDMNKIFNPVRNPLRLAYVCQLASFRRDNQTHLNKLFSLVKNPLSLSYVNQLAGISKGDN